MKKIHLLLLAVVAFIGILGAFSLVSLTSQVTGVLPIANGGSNSTTAAAARTAFGLDFYSLAGSYLGTPDASTTLFLFVAEQAFTLPVNLTNSQFKCGTNPSGEASFTIFLEHSGWSQVGTFSFSTGGVATNTVVATINVVAGDQIKVMSYTTMNSIADVVWTLKGSL